MVIQPDILFQAIVLSLIAALIAGVYPAVKAGKINIGSALRME
jgi:putative ABC transport system permease protein